MSAQTLSVHDLAFRAACNTAAAESKRPLRRRVIERLAASPETRALISDLQPLVSAMAGGGLFDLLANDARWKTLVAETVADSLRWDDLASQGASWGQRLVTIWRKFIEGDDQQVARIVVAVIASLGVYRIAADNSPPEPLDVKFRLSADTNSIPVSLPVSFATQTDGAPIPVKLDLQAESKPILVNVSAAGYTKELRLALDQLRDATATVAGLAKRPAADDQDLVTHLKEIERLVGKVVDLQASTVEAVAGQRHEITVDEKHPRILLVQSLDPKAGYRVMNVELCLASVDQPNGHASVRYSVGVAGTEPACVGDKAIKEGEVRPLTIGTSDWMLAVHSVKRRLNGQGRATFSLRPQIPQIRDVTQARNAGTSTSD